MKPLLSFCVSSDMHFMAWKETNAPVEWVPQLEACLQDIALFRPDFLVSNGDMTNGKERDWRLVLAYMKENCPFPVYFTMGNHEYYGYYEDLNFTPKLAQQRFLAFSGHDSIYYAKIIHGFLFLFLSTETYTPDMNDAGWLSDEQLNWLEQQLHVSDYHLPLFIFFHQPVNGTVAESKRTCNQSEKLMALLRQRPNIFFFTGHTHCPMDRPNQLIQQDGVIFVGGGALCTETPQSRWVELYHNHVKIKLRDHKHINWVEEYLYTFSF
ncbi:metallophosphoesterase [Paenibacillus sp. LjRoot153]|uniref:metallophosphoesterase family protein n=1 Tax=Paenibacillus sp. LjRoot153 TaxID=3342270 RepID=UPI003ECF4032